ncbi:MAG: hypothetical protein ACU0GG_13735 [Paracoccaceae bacterium]
MFEELSREDWQRIVFALSQFSHNPEFTETLAKVTKILEEDE